MTSPVSGLIFSMILEGWEPAWLLDGRSFCVSTKGKPEIPAGAGPEERGAGTAQDAVPDSWRGAARGSACPAMAPGLASPEGEATGPERREEPES